MKLNEAIVIPRQGSRAPIEPLRDADSIRVYHGTSSPQIVYAALTRGISGGSHVVRRYSYEQNNNPRGLFVSPDLKTAKDFGDYVIEFHSRVRDLESPVWPGGTFTVQGGMSGIFSNDQERELERMAKRNHWSQSDIDYIANSDRPELAAMLLHAGERQALFTGDLNANSIRAIWVSRDPTYTDQPYDRVSPKDFIRMYEDKTLPSRFGMEDPVSYKITRRVIDPRDSVSGKEFIDIFREKKDIEMDDATLVMILKQNPDYIENHVWSDRQFNRIWKDIQSM